MYTLNRCENAATAAQYLSEQVANALNRVLQTQERATLAVSGGRSPIAFFQALSQTDLAWERVNITLVDERIVPTTHADSNTQLVRQYLLQNQAAEATWLPMIDDAADECRLQDTQAAVDFALQHHQPADVVVLGMGGDGHTASLFPQAPQFANGIRADYPQPLLHTTPVTAPHERISMTLAAIERSSAQFLAIAGAEKMAVLEQAKQQVQTALPISYVLHSEQTQLNIVYHD
ncbi:MAG: 6-phosphogluconolactonase [Neisseria sp.]|nr:6-phosphogluconolactonase [Neisseria sp.]